MSENVFLSLAEGYVPKWAFDLAQVEADMDKARAALILAQEDLSRLAAEKDEIINRRADWLKEVQNRAAKLAGGGIP